MNGLLLLLGLGLVVLWLCVVAYIVRALAYPARRGYAEAVSRGWPGDPGELERPAVFERWEAGEPRCVVWELQGDDPAGPVVVMTHGWSRSKVDSLVRFGAVRGVCSRAVAWDMPGHGESRGRCGLGATEWTVLREIVDRVRGDGSGGPAVVLWGWSMGAGVSIRAAAEMRGTGRVQGVIAENGYALPATPARNVLRSAGLPWRGVLGPALVMVGIARGLGPRWRGFDRREIAARVDVPLLVVHGELDEISPVRDGQEIAAAAPEGEVVEIAGGTHNGLWTDEGTSGAVGGTVRGFLGRFRSSA